MANHYNGAQTCEDRPSTDYAKQNLASSFQQSITDRIIGPGIAAQQRPSSELMADLYNAIESQQRSIILLDAFVQRIFGPEPMQEPVKEPNYAEHLTAMIARCRRMAEAITNRLESINSNI